jgi:Holliday junction resolvasome RuvABC endonuclease subunit
VKLVLGVEVTNNHASDALAVAICHATAPRALQVPA